MQILWDNKIGDATVTANTENPNYLLENIEDTRLSRVYRSLDTNEEWIKFAGSIKASRFAILGHNLSSSATIRLQGNATDVWTAPTFNEIITWNAGIIIHKFTEATYAYWRLYIDDDSNPDSYLQIGFLFLGTYLQLPGMAQGQSLPKATTGKVDHSSSMQAYGDQGIIYRNPEIEFPFVTNDERDDVNEMYDAVQNSTPVITEIWANSDIEPPLYGTIDQEIIAWKRTGKVLVPWSFKLKLKECF